MAKFRKRWARVGVRQVTTQPADNDSASLLLSFKASRLREGKNRDCRVNTLF